MINLIQNDKLQLVTAQAADIDVHVSWIEAVVTTCVPSNSGRQNTSIATATTTDILSTPGASTLKNAKSIMITNKDTADSCVVTPIYNQNGTSFDLFPDTTLLAGEALCYTEGTGWFTYKTPIFWRMLRCGTDYVNATTSFSDITGLTCPVENGKTYCYEAHLFHAENATTTGPRFGINGPSLTNVVVSVLGVVTVGVDTTTMHSGVATAVDTSGAGATLTGKTAYALDLVSGSFTAGANGTFAMRGQSEIAVAAGLTVKAGSFCMLWQPTG